ncbi:nitrile hydratase accessory protein [Acetobacteraceae bacterium AT-5844]|nr:nitrile hydratase accessory protein [Acetobacteraceae bacterium AT-5844]
MPPETVPASLLNLPRGEEGEPVFREPWEAQAFAMAVSLHATGHFTWAEWAEALGRHIAADRCGDVAYYQHWLAALEELVAAKKILDPTRLATRREEWRQAAAATPHGQPILLPEA